MNARSEDSDGASKLATDHRLAFTNRIVELLMRSAFKQPVRWSLAVVVLRGPHEISYVTSRVDFAAELRNADLKAAARECLNRRTRPVLWIEVDDADIATAGFHVLAIARETRALLTSL